MNDLDAEMTPAERREGLRADVAVMRELGVSHWRDIVLGPVVTQDSDSTTQRRLAPDQAAAMERDARRRIALAASGAPVKRPGEEHSL